MKFIIPMFGDQYGDCDHVFVELSDEARKRLLEQRELLQMMKTKSTLIAQLLIHPVGDWCFITRGDESIFGSEDEDFPTVGALSKRECILLEENEFVNLSEEFACPEDPNPVCVDSVFIIIHEQGPIWMANLSNEMAAESRQLSWNDIVSGGISR